MQPFKLIKQIVFIFLWMLSLTTIVTAQKSVSMVVDGFRPSTVISKHIYGHFSEHLGRCIYDGFWVSDTSSIVKKDRIILTYYDGYREEQAKYQKNKYYAVLWKEKNIYK